MTEEMRKEEAAPGEAEKGWVKPLYMEWLVIVFITVPILVRQIRLIGKLDVCKWSFG